MHIIDIVESMPVMTKRETVLYRTRPTQPEPSCHCGDIECVDTRFDNPEPVQPPAEELEIMDYNYSMEQGNIPDVHDVYFEGKW